MDKVRIGVVGGAAGIGLGSHLPAIDALTQAELVAVCDVNEEGLREVSARYGVATYTDLDSMLSRDDIDLLDIASPDHLHASHTIAAAKAGKHVLCEKPMALSLDDARAMKEAVAAQGVKFMVAQCMRWLPECISFKEACGRIGPAVFGVYHVKGRFYSYPANSPYRKKNSLGQFVHNGMHYVDFLSWCMDSLPARVHARSLSHYPTEDRLETDNYLLAMVTMESGATALYELNLLLIDPPGYPGETWWSVIGTQGTADWGRKGSRNLEMFSRTGMSHPRPGVAGTDRDSFRGEIGHMCDCIIRDEPPCIPIDWSIRVLATCLGAVESAETGNVVELA
ncbi:MAG: Gfo/Idh/MocA family oxidoreductase [Armatimonadetes bacterium]|nr:Gfo/Idh/MocA family oxidoreductase [Armatimonadota bacterium]